MLPHRSRFLLHITLGLTGLLLATSAAHAVQIITGPTLTLDPNGTTPLAAVVEMETDEFVQVEMTVSDGIDGWSVSFPDAEQLHYLPVLGLKADRTYSVTILLIPGGLAGNLLVTTAPLPADFPTIVAAVSDPAAMEPGYTLLDCIARDPGDSRPRYTIITDSAGDVVWYSTFCATALRQLDNGNLLYRQGLPLAAAEMDMLGNRTLEVPLQNPGSALHHDFLRTTNGTYLSLTRESVLVEDFPTSDTDPAAPPADAIVRDEPVVEFLPDGNLRREWFLTDFMDPRRIGYLSLTSTAEGFDWAHTNAAVYVPSDDSILVSARHQDAVVKFSRETGELIWILGPHDNWSPEFQPYLLHPLGPFEWQYHQHAPMITGDGTLVLYDNGNFRASPFDGNPQVPDPDNFSRGVEYEIDEQAMTIRQVWEYGENASERLYTAFICDADWQETTGNVMITFGSVSYVGGIPSADLGLGFLHTRIIEVTDDRIPVKVFELQLYDPTGGRITVYRSERIPSLYPLQYLNAPNGVGNTLIASQSSGSLRFDWATSPVDSVHDAADYYITYVSSSPDSGFTVFDSTAQTNLAPGSGPGLEFYKIVAANTSGTSGDEPAP